MTTFVITCPNELPEEHAACVAHLKERGIDANFINGIHAETFGILAWRPYRKDNPKAGDLVKMAATGLALTHHMIWQLCAYHWDDTFLILEADAELPENWKEKLDQALKDVPEDWDILLIGNSNTSDKPTTHINGEIFDVRYPFCTHCYAVRQKALTALLSVRDAACNVDIAMIDRAYPKLKVFSVIPSFVTQRGRELAP